jgi:uncharacterized protein YjbI with pentapeptide repeats
MTFPNSQALSTLTDSMANLEVAFIEESALSRIELRHVCIRSCKLFHVTLRDCKVTSSELDSCKVFSSTISKSELVGTEVLTSNLLGGVIATKSFLDQSLARNSQLIDSSLKNTKVHNSKVRDGSAAESQLNSCDIHGVAMHKRRLMSCNIERCKLLGTFVNDIKLLVKTSMSKCEVSTSPLAFRKFAPEI